MRVPVYQRHVEAVSPAPARADVSGMGLGGGLKALGRALEEGADTWYQVTVRRQEADRTIAAITTQTAAMKELDDLETAYSEDPDYAGAEDRYHQKVDELVEGYGKRFDGDPRRGAEFAQTMQRLKEAGALKLRQRAIGKRADAATAALDDSIATAKQIAAEGNRVQEEEADRAVETQIQAAADAGLITREDGGKRWRDYQSDTSEQKVLRARRTDPATALADLADPSKYPGLSPVARERQMKGAQAEVDSQLAEAERRQRRAHAEAEKALRQQGDAAAKDMYGKAADSTLNRAWLESRKSVLSPTEYNAGLKLLNPDTLDVKNNPDVLRDIERRIDDEDVKADVLQHIGRDLSIPTAQELLDKNRRLRGEEGPPSGYKSGRVLIKDTLGAEGQLYTTPEGAAIAKRRAADASDEYDTWARAHPNATTQEHIDRAHEIIGRAQAISLSNIKMSLVVPRFVTVDRDAITAKDLDAAEDRVIAARRAGQLSEEEFTLEDRRIADWRRTLAKEEQARKPKGAK